ncbi:hypothetical protein [Pseudomonas allokribbensis]|uniref:hypothetical protein n=1 Tax=Pseudomonas allokribbensis TaxID=2774460 RepID=UPI001787B417|nr:hypothetical protein [Pseudomonas allokribbensis]
MSYTYDGLASVAVLALYRGRPTNKQTTFELAVRVIKVAPKRFRVEFAHYLQGPQEANTLQVMLPDGMLLQGPIIDGSNEPAGGWLLINVEPHELPNEPRTRVGRRMHSDR